MDAVSVSANNVLVTMKILFQAMKESPNKALAAHIVRCASSLSPSTRRVCKCYCKGRDVMLWEKHDQSKCDCSSEDFTKPLLSLGNRMKRLKMGSKNKLQQKESITLESSQQIIIILATQLERITAKVSGISLQHLVVKDLSCVDCKCFISKWSKELKCLKPKNKDKVSYAESFRNCSEGLNVCKLFKGETLTEDLKDLLWWIHVLQSFPKSSVCQDGCSRVELLNLYSQWKKGQLINVFPIIDFIMRTLLTEKLSISKQELQQMSITEKSHYKQRIPDYTCTV